MSAQWPVTVVMTVVLCVAPGCYQQKRYQGHDLEYWLLSIDSSDPSIRNEAKDVLTRVLEEDRSEFNRQLAVDKLVRFDPRDANTTRTLKALMKSARPDIRRSALKSAVFLALSPPAPADVMMEVVLALRDPEASVRRQACLTLYNWRPVDPEMINGLLIALKDNDESVSFAAADSLLAAAQNDALAVMLLTERLKDKKVRVQIVRILGKLEKRSNSALGALKGELTDADSQYREEVKEALRRVSGAR